MKYLQSDAWCIIDENFDPKNQQASESYFSLGNGHIYQQANFEEYFSGETILGSYVAGISDVEKQEKNYWKARYQQVTDKIVNAPNWTGIIVRLNEDRLDLATWEVQNFRRVLNMREGFLERTFDAISTQGHHIQVSVKRFLSMSETEIAAMSCSVKSMNFEGRISFMPIIDGDLKDQLLDVNETAWNVLQTKTQRDVAHLWTQTRHTNFHICEAMTYVFYKNNEQLNIIPTKIEKEKVAGFSIGTDVKTGDTVCLNKYVAIVNTLNHSWTEITGIACAQARIAKQKGWNGLLEDHSAVLGQRWIDSAVNFEDKTQTKETLYKAYHDIVNNLSD